MAVLLTLFVGLRYYTGADWMMYLTAFEHPEWVFKSFESGYVFVSQIFRIIFNNYYVFQFTASAFIIFAASRLFKKYSNYPIACLALMLCFLMRNILMAQVRQSIALAIIVLFADYIFDRKLVHFLLVVFIAMLFHKSALVALPLYLLYKNYGKILPISLILVANVFYFYPETLAAIVNSIAPFLPGGLSTKVAEYLTTVHADAMKFNTGLYYFGQLTIILVVIIFSKMKDKRTAFFANSLAIFAIVRAFTISIKIFERVEAYYLIFGLLAIASVWDVDLKFIKTKISKPIIAAAIIAFLFIPNVKFLLPSNPNVSPLNGRKEAYQWKPYYNCIIHPKEASQRLDWWQQ
ncbi:hypothetical protein FACS1894180_3380 [Bacteroidia bacterium]|nr:hypothetical protein FACS1894180_3380 [Bacteroidia bacterium]